MAEAKRAAQQLKRLEKQLASTPSGSTYKKALAHHKIAQWHYNQQDYKQAIVHFEQVGTCPRIPVFSNGHDSSLTNCFY